MSPIYAVHDNGRPSEPSPKFAELGLEPECPVRDLLLVGGPAAGGHVSMPEQGTGEFVIHHLPLDIEEFQNADGEWDYHVRGGGGTTDPLTGEALGSMVYKVCDIEQPDGQYVAHFVRSDHNPTSEDQDELESQAPYLKNDALGAPLTRVVLIDKREGTVTGEVAT